MSTTSLAESASAADDLSQVSPQILRVEKIERRPSYEVHSKFDVVSSGADGDAALGHGDSKIVERQSLPGQVLPDFIRLRPDLRPEITDEEILQWRSVSHPHSTNTRLELQAKTVAAAEEARAIKNAWDSNSVGNMTDKSPTASAKASLEGLVGANRSILIPEGINPDALITPDVRSKLAAMSDEQRIHRLRVMREHRAGTPPKVFHDYINMLVDKASETYQPAPTQVGRKLDSSQFTAEGHNYLEQEPFNNVLDDEFVDVASNEVENMYIPTSGISARISYDADGGFDESSKQSIIESVSIRHEDDGDDDLSSTLSVSRLTSPNRAASTSHENDDRQIKVSGEGNLHLYRVNDPHPASPQATALSEGSDTKPLYYESAKREAEQMAKAEKVDSILLAKTTLFSRDFPHRPDGEEYFTTEKPSSPHSPFDSKAERVRQLIVHAEERRTASRQGARTTGTIGDKPRSRDGRRAKKTSSSPQKSKPHTSTDISKTAIKCFSECKRNATLWCKDCALPFCPACWIKVPHHEYVTSEQAWDEMNVANSIAFKSRATTAHPSAGDAKPYSVAISRDGFRHDIRTVPAHSDETSVHSAGTTSTAISNITPTVYLDASGKIKRVPLNGDINGGSIYAGVDDDVLTGEKGGNYDASRTKTSSDMGSVDLEREHDSDQMAKRLMRSVTSQPGSISFLSAMALQAHEHAIHKKASVNEIKFNGDPNEWKKINAVGKLPPIKYSQVDEKVLERRKTLKRWEILNRPGKLDVDPQKRQPGYPGGDSESLQEVFSREIDDSINFIDSLEPLNVSLEDTAKSSLTKDNYGDAKVVTDENPEKSSRRSRVYTRKTPSIGYTASGGIGLGVGYKVNPEAQTIIGITKEKLFQHNYEMSSLSAATPETIGSSNQSMHIQIINGVAVHTLPPSVTSSDQSDEIDPKDVYRLNEKRRKKEKKVKSRVTFINGQKDDVLDSRNVKVNPLLVDIYGKNYFKRKDFKPYENVPPVKHVNLKKRNTMKKIVGDNDYKDTISALSEKMNQVMNQQPFVAKNDNTS